MATIIPQAIKKAQNIAMGAHGDDKQADLAKDTKTPTAKDLFTSDAGVRQSSADDWLKVVSDNHTGPELLEDPFSREKVMTDRVYPNQNLARLIIFPRFTGSIMRGSLRESSTPGEAAPLEHSGF